jgi:hypothetical protein
MLILDFAYLFTQKFYYIRKPLQTTKIANWENERNEKKREKYFAMILERKLSGLRHIYLIILSS